MYYLSFFWVPRSFRDMVNGVLKFKVVTNSDQMVVIPVKTQHWWPALYPGQLEMDAFQAAVWAD